MLFSRLLSKQVLSSTKCVSKKLSVHVTSEQYTSYASGEKWKLILLLNAYNDVVDSEGYKKAFTYNLGLYSIQSHKIVLYHSFKC